MNILYGIQGVGNGHISRSKIIIKELKKHGHNVRVILSGRKHYKDIEDLAPYEIYEGIPFQTKDGAIQYVETYKQARVIQFFKDIQKIDAKDIDLVINDFEPLTSWVARTHNITSIGIGHQYAFYFDVPMRKRDILAKLVLQNYAPVDYPVGLHWHHFDKLILPPIINKVPKKKTKKNKLLVYLPWESQDDIRDFLKPFSDYEFHIYIDIEKPLIEGHLHWKPYSPHLLDDLADSTGVISNAGFELPSEALSVGKKLLVKPCKGQGEQQANALSLEEMGYATKMKDLDPQILEDWLESDAPRGINVVYDVGVLVDWIEKGDYKNSSELLKRYWK